MNKTLTPIQIAAVMEIVDEHFGIYPADDPMRDRFAQAMRSLLATQQPEPRDEVTDAAIAAVDRVLKANAVFFGRLKLQEIVNAARTGASHE